MFLILIFLTNYLISSFRFLDTFSDSAEEKKQKKTMKLKGRLKQDEPLCDGLVGIIIVTLSTRPCVC